VQRIAPAHEAAAAHAAVKHQHSHDSILQRDCRARTQARVRLQRKTAAAQQSEQKMYKLK
jgi:hypothetical protein